MKRIIILFLGILLTVTVPALGQSKEGDQKWIQAVEKMVAKGETKITTPSEGRVKLLKEWAEKRSYSVHVTKTETGFQLDLSKVVAQK